MENCCFSDCSDIVKNFALAQPLLYTVSKKKKKTHTSGLKTAQTRTLPRALKEANEYWQHSFGQMKSKYIYWTQMASSMFGVDLARITTAGGRSIQVLTMLDI